LTFLAFDFATVDLEEIRRVPKYVLQICQINSGEEKDLIYFEEIIKENYS
jgi:hypothetical protein